MERQGGYWDPGVRTARGVSRKALFTHSGWNCAAEMPFKRMVDTTIQHSFGSVGHSNQGRKRSKRNPDRKRRSETLSVCR